MPDLAITNAIWIGPELGKIQVACLRSFVRAGHRTILHCFTPPNDVPKGVELADAGKLLPESRLTRHKASGSVAIFSDLLRYEILRAGLGLYVDCDMYCVRPIADEQHIFGWSSSKAINNAVLKLPAESPALLDLCAIKNGGFVPPWFTLRHKIRLRLGQMLGRPAPSIEELPWGSTGPTALTWYARHYGIDRYAKAKEVFYPIDNHAIALLFDPERTIDDLITPRTTAVHLYNEYFKRRSLHVIPIPPSSPLGRILAA
jgi:hypothetical protein